MRIVQISVGSVRIPPEEGSAPLLVIYNTSKHMVQMGNEVSILDRKYSRNDGDEVIAGVKVVRLKARQVPLKGPPGLWRFILAELNAFLFALSVSSYLRRNNKNIDAIHLHLTSIALILCILNRKLRYKMFYTCHLGQWIQDEEKLHLFERIHLFLDPYVMRRVHGVIALNDTAKSRFILKGRVKEDRITVVPNGVDIDCFRPNDGERETARKEYGLNGKTTILFVGRLARLKGIEYLLQAANLIVNSYGRNDVLFRFIGPQVFDATEQRVGIEELVDYVKEHRLDPNVLFTGSLAHDEVRRWYIAADIFVLPSLAEGDPLVTLEAMASGKPLIGTRVGGILNQIRDGWNGFLVDPGDKQQIADSIKYLLDNPKEMEKMGRNSREYAVQNFSWRKVAEKLVLSYAV
jgi:starch synthase